jgi:hypothetical protein
MKQVFRKKFFIFVLKFVAPALAGEILLGFLF